MRTGYSILITCLFLYSSVATLGQDYADKDYYLVDSLNLETLTEADRHLVDSCLDIYHMAKQDTDKVNALNGICSRMMDEGWHKYQYFQYRLIQNAMAQLSGPPISPTARTLRVALAGALNNIGFILKNQGNIPLALEYYHKSLEILEDILDKQGMAASYNNIGSIHDNQGDIHVALEYYHKSLKIKQEILDKHGMATSYNNLGLIHDNQGNIPLALEYYHKSLKIREEILDKEGMAYVCHNIGSLLCQLDSVHKGLIYLKRGLQLAEEIGDKQGVSDRLAAIGNQSLVLGQLQQAREHGEQGLSIAREIGFPNQIERNAELLTKVARKQGRFKEALEMYELQVQYRDSVKNEETQKASIRQQTKYEFEKAQLVKEQEEKEQARVLAEETSRRDNLQYSVILIALLVLFGGVLSLGFIKVSPRMAEGIIFFSFLILFEFLLVLADPYVDRWSGGAPGIKLLFNAGIAAVIFPAHAFFEERLKGRLVKSKD